MKWFDCYGNIPSKKYKERLAQYENEVEFQIQFNRGVNIHLDEFEYENLPETCDPIAIEKNLLFRPAAGFYEDATGNILTLGCAPGGMLNINGRETEAELFAPDGKFFANAEIYWPQMQNEETANCVIIKDNETGFPPIYAVEMGAKRITEARRNLDTAAKNCKFPYMLECSEEQKRNVLNIYEKVQENQPIILVNKGNDVTEKGTNTMSTHLQAGILKELWDFYTNTKADVYQDWGVQMNNNNDKKERMTITEVEGDTTFIKIVNAYRLAKRREALEIANKRWGLNMKVKFRHEDEEHDESVLELLQKGDEKDEDKETR